MKKFQRYTYVWVLLFFSLTITASDGDFETLLQQFEKTGKAQEANRLFKWLGDQEFTDSLVQFDSAMPTDSLRQQVWYWAAEYFYDQQQYQKAVEYGEKALPLMKGKSGESDCLNLLAIVFIRLADYNSAAKYAKLCYAIDEKSGDPDMMSSSLNTLAAIYMSANQPEEAEKYILKGLEMARREVPDLIISDVMMPVMNGLEFCQHVKDDFITSHIPVILLTARAMSQHQVEGYKSGADAYITKPFSPELLLARIDNLLRNRVLLKNLWENEQPATGSNTRKESADTAQPEPKMENTFLSRFKTYVEAHLADSELSIEAIGQELGLSRVQLYRKIKALTGSTPIDLLRKARLAHARQLLSDASLSVSEIAYQSGFTSPSYFTKCFKDEYGMVPGDMRK